MKANKIIPLALVALAVGAAVPAAAAAVDTPDTAVTLVVQNNNLQTVTVFAVLTDGKLRELGRVRSTAERTFEIPEALLQDGENLQIKVFPYRGPKGGLTHGVLEPNQGIKTHPIPVASGSIVDLWVERDLRTSRVFLGQ